MTPPPPPSERFLIFHRIITFLDEWLFYALLTFLFFKGVTLWIFIPVVVIGAAVIFKSYKRLWAWEDTRHEN